MMQSFYAIPNVVDSQKTDRPLMQKDKYEVSKHLQAYLLKYNKVYQLPLNYLNLLHYRYTDAIRDNNGKHTHWEKVTYSEETWQQLKPQLIAVASYLFKKSNINRVQSIEFCEYANSMPFRVKLNDEDGEGYVYYIKSADASRIFGLELEYLLNNENTDYLYNDQTLIEAEIDGIAGDDFLPQINSQYPSLKKEIALAFIAFNESCFARLLGDMRSYNFVVTREFGQSFYFRTIDFDNQCSEGSLNFYLPQFYKENYGFVQLVKQELNQQIIDKHRMEERMRLRKNALKYKSRLQELLHLMSFETLADHYKVLQLRQQLNEYYPTAAFSNCNTMGQILQLQLQLLLAPIF